MKVRIAAVAIALVAAAGSASCRRSPVEPTCTIALEPETRNVAAGGATATVTVSASDPTCGWTAISQATWVTIVSGAAGTGSGTVTYNVGANESVDSRTTTIKVEDKVHTIAQAGKEPPIECTYSLSPDRVEVGPKGGTGAVDVTAPDGCAWTAESNDNWLTIEGAASKVGTGRFEYRVAEHEGTNTREGTVDVADRVFRVRQEGVDTTACTYAVSPVNLESCMPEGTVTTRIETAAGCSWTAASKAGWLGVSATSGRGPATLTLSFTANYRAPRTGTVEIRWPTPTAGQNVFVAQAGCVYATPTPTVNVAAGGGSAGFDVLQQALPSSCGGPLQDRCIWTARADTPWITVTTGMPRQGDQRVQLSIAVNPSTGSRTGTVTVEDLTVQVVQAGSGS